MAITITKVVNKKQMNDFVTFPWKVMAGDPYWVPPFLSDRRNKLDIHKNSFWNNTEQEIFVAYINGKPVGTIVPIFEKSNLKYQKESLGTFGFFDCINDQNVASALFVTAASWLRSRGIKKMRGPYNPSPNDEVGVLVEGFDTLPALMEAHTPRYYPALFESNGFHKQQDIVARHVFHKPEDRSLADVLPEKMLRVASLVQKRPDLTIRPVDLQNWESEIHLATDVYNQALRPVPESTLIPYEEFLSFANSFKSILDPQMALFAEIDHQAVGFALAIPDYNQVFLHMNGRQNIVSILKALYYRRKIDRVSFKILVMIPEFQNRGIETALVVQVSKAIWEKGYREVDMSLTGEENEKSNRYQDNFGMTVYRRYRIYQKDI